MKRRATSSLLLLVFSLSAFSFALAYEDNPDSLNIWVESNINSTNDTNEIYRKAHLSLFLANNENHEAALISAYLNLAGLHNKYGQLDSSIYYFKELKNIYKKCREQ
ncbi:MAG: hypothetical protein R2764_10465 [Bacteroidales bacterium]